MGRGARGKSRREVCIVFTARMEQKRRDDAPHCRLRHEASAMESKPTDP